ncbi:MAG: glutamate-5-semialdehyde dehydrogenase [Clostridiales bacterium]|nr:glutamate-5-semialdehyde dehydrogenase [Clostridiales bacterium]
MSYLVELGKKAKEASRVLNTLEQVMKNQALKKAAKLLIEREDEIIEANKIDVANGRDNGMTEALIDRLTLNHDRILGMSQGLLDVAALDDPIGEVVSMKSLPNGLQIGQKVVPIGVIGIIYESRPNVTADAFGLCFKSGNAVILRGGSDAINSNKLIASIIQEALEQEGLPKYSIQLIENTDRQVVNQMMKLNQYIDVLIPRGGAGLIKSVIENATIPVIETGTGNCHIYVDKYADFAMALDIIVNAKTQRLGVCNACEALVVHKDIAKEFIPLLFDRLSKAQVEVRGDDLAREISPAICEASEEDFATEYLDKIISLKVVESLEDGISHINRYSTRHSEAIITENYHNALKFLNEIDAAAVYVNASTRFTDGAEFGLGAEIGISTQKLHARGPMGLKALTTTKYIIMGNGQIRK